MRARRLQNNQEPRTTPPATYEGQDDATIGGKDDGKDGSVGPPARRAEHAPRESGPGRVYAGGRPGVPERARSSSTSVPSVESVRVPRSYGDGTEVASLDHRHLSAEEIEARRVVVRQLVALGVTTDQLPGAMADQGWPMSREVGRREYDAVMAEWASDHAHLRETTRVAQIVRLQSDLARYRRDKRWQAVVQTEALLARVCGHLAATQVEVKVETHVVVREALVEVVAGMSEDEMDRLVAEENELEQLAAQARRLGPRVVEAEGVEVP